LDQREAARQFADLVQAPEGAFGLDRASLLISAAANADLDLDEQLARIDALAEKASSTSIDGVIEVLFREIGLRGNTWDYGDPRNSYLDQVLERRAGIPISLSVVTMEVARRLGVVLEGIGLPGHFVVRPSGAEGVFIDAFHGGEILDAAGCASLLERVHGRHVALSSEMLGPVGPRAILSRMLANLQASWSARADASQLGQVTALRLSIPDLPLEVRAQAAGVLAGIGRFGEAAGVMEDMADGPSSDLMGAARGLRARLN
jgi:regulator of sirC expression with transglutaminase-like and TPR domain